MAGVDGSPQQDLPKPPAWESWYRPARPQAGPPAGGGGNAADPDATRPDLGAVPPVGTPTTMLGDLRPAPPAGGPRRPRRLPAPAIAVAGLLVVVGGIAVFLVQSNGPGASGAAAAKGATPSATASLSSQATRRQVAVQLSGLLGQSVADRGDVIDAVTDVRGCGPSLHEDARTFARAAHSRQRLVARLRSLPGRSLLPAAMLQDLTGGWQASARADTDLARWADATIARGCRNGRADAILRASYVPDGQATAAKQAFARLWDPLARRYGLTAYRWDQL